MPTPSEAESLVKIQEMNYVDGAHSADRRVEAALKGALRRRDF
jgi:hypothetical protein